MPVWQTSKGYDLFSRNDLSTRIGLAADVEVVDVAANTPLAVEFGWAAESQSETALGVGSVASSSGSALIGDFTSELLAHDLHLGLKLQHRVLPFLAPHFRVAGGATWIQSRFTLPSSMSAGEFESHDWLGFALVGVGVTAALPTTIAVRPGLSFEGGYLVSQSMPLRLEPTTSEQAIALSGASLGTLERSGPYLRFGAFLRY